MNCPKCGSILPDDATQCTTCGNNLQRNNQSPYAQPMNSNFELKGDPTKNGMATASLVFGILSLVCISFLGIISIILGFLSLKSEKRGFSIAGIIMGSIALILTIIGIIIITQTDILNDLLNNYQKLSQLQ